MSDIPKARDELMALAEKCGPVTAGLIHDIVNQYLFREPPVRKTKVKSTALTPTGAKRIRAFARLNPTLSHQEIANIFNVNPGRVSEAMNGKR